MAEKIIANGETKWPSLRDLGQTIIDGEYKRAAELTQVALDEGIDPLDVLNQGLQLGITEVGREFKEEKLFVPEVLLAARAMHAGLDVLRPLLAETGMPTIGKVIIGTVAGDMHDIGKNLVVMMLEGTGFEVVDLGVNVLAEEFIKATEEHSPQIVGVSALLTTTMPQMKKIIEMLVATGVRNRVKVVVGGAPVTREYASRIGADAYGKDAGDAADVCKSLVGGA